MSVLPTSAPASPRAASIREATPDDLPAIRDLLSQRDHRSWDDASTRWFVHDLHPDRCRAWIARVDNAAVALSTMFLRTLRGPGGPYRAGYWANLYIDPAYRDLMLYPRLPLAMFATARTLGLDLLYGSVRLRDLAVAHTRIGFARLGTMPVLVKPLRPVRLIAKYKRWPALAALAPPLDALWGAVGLRHRSLRGVEVERRDIQESTAPDVAALLAASAGDRIADAWTPDSFRYRYRQTREGPPYRLIGIRRSGDWIGALVYRFAERDPRIRACVVMDAICMPGEESSLPAAVAAAEADAHGADCELMLFLDGLGPAVSTALRSCGYRPSPEAYDLLVWPKERASDPLLGRADRWRFGFGDHDAF